MWEKLKSFFEFSAKTGLYLPAAYDQSRDVPSVTLLFTHLANALALGSILFLITQDAKSGAQLAILYSVITMVLYLMRRISSFKVDADDGEIELNSEENPPEKKDE